MSIYKIKHTCAQCNGDGTWDHYKNGLPDGDETCPMCGGSGLMVIGQVDLADLDDKLDDILDKCKDILEKL